MGIKGIFNFKAFLFLKINRKTKKNKIPQKDEQSAEKIKPGIPDIKPQNKL